MVPRSWGLKQCHTGFILPGDGMDLSMDKYKTQARPIKVDMPPIFNSQQASINSNFFREMSTSDIIQKVAAAEPLTTEDEEFWWQATGISFATLLDRSGHTADQLEYHLSWYRRFIPASLGPKPVAGTKYRFLAGPVWDGSPVEFSLNWKEKVKSSRLVRFAYGASNSDAGTEADPFGQEETGRLLRSMSDLIPNFSMRTYDTLAENLFIKKEAQPALIANLAPDFPRTQVWTAFDVKSSGLLAKVYFLPFLKLAETGKQSNDLISSVFSQCHSDFGSYTEGADTLNSYISTFSAAPELGPQLGFFGIDCSDGPGARLKAYMATKANTLNKAKDLFTLGGRITGPNAEGGLTALGEFWPIFFGLEGSDDPDDAVVFPSGSGCIACVEVKPGHAIPEVKIHIPINLGFPLDIKDSEICDRLAKWFRSRGDHDFADTYRSDLQEAM